MAVIIMTTVVAMLVGVLQGLGWLDDGSTAALAVVMEAIMEVLGMVVASSDQRCSGQRFSGGDLLRR